MSNIKITIEISEQELKEALNEIIARKITSDSFCSLERNMYKRIISESTRDIIYKDKDEIIKRVVAQSSREITSKASKIFSNTIISMPTRE